MATGKPEHAHAQERAGGGFGDGIAAFRPVPSPGGLRWHIEAKRCTPCYRSPPFRSIIATTQPRSCG
jgi:hypothetical protein